jgi:inosine-uridine nucleoside N-ribohydrolase
VWVDTDPAVGLPLHDCDDGFALWQAMHDPRLDVLGVTVGYGNTSARRALKITHELWARLTFNTVPLYAGAEKAGSIPGSHHGLDALTSALEKAQVPLTLIALGPATLYAALIQRRPDLINTIEKMIWVAGRKPGERLHFGSRCSYEFHDANFEKDPTAAKTLLNSGVPLCLLPVGLGPELMLTEADFRQLRQRGGYAGVWLTRKSWLWLFLWKTCFGLEGAPVFDCLAVLAAARPEVLFFEACQIELHSDKRPCLNYRQALASSHHVCTGVHADAQAQLFHFNG